LPNSSEASFPMRRRNLSLRDWLAIQRCSRRWQVNPFLIFSYLTARLRASQWAPRMWRMLAGWSRRRNAGWHLRRMVRSYIHGKWWRKGKLPLHIKACCMLARSLPRRLLTSCWIPPL